MVPAESPTKFCWKHQTLLVQPCASAAAQSIFTSKLEFLSWERKWGGSSPALQLNWALPHFSASSGCISNFQLSQPTYHIGCTTITAQLSQYKSSCLSTQGKSLLEAILHRSRIGNAPRSPGNLGFMVRHNSNPPVPAADKKPEIWKLGELWFPNFCILRPTGSKTSPGIPRVSGSCREPDLWGLLWKFDTFPLPLEIKPEVNFRTLPGCEEHRVQHCALFCFAFVSLKFL